MRSVLATGILVVAAACGEDAPAPMGGGAGHAGSDGIGPGGDGAQAGSDAAGAGAPASAGAPTNGEAGSTGEGDGGQAGSPDGPVNGLVRWGRTALPDVV